MNPHLSKRLHAPVVIDNDGVHVDGTSLLVEEGSVNVEDYLDQGLQKVTVTMLTDNLIISDDMKHGARVNYEVVERRWEP
ncbi:hypothetical protein ACT3SZ_15550 [Corynebacterium sp. AOP40-9SA-29]|uniref:hypothetical protein n=1 Tax=Corynebacterium sp. AOP40-9SA-29 TaxID=3457677 RepID=UPI004033C681